MVRNLPLSSFAAALDKGPLFPFICLFSALNIWVYSFKVSCLLAFGNQSKPLNWDLPSLISSLPMILFYLLMPPFPMLMLLMKYLLSSVTARDKKLLKRSLSFYSLKIPLSHVTLLSTLILICLKPRSSTNIWDFLLNSLIVVREILTSFFTKSKTSWLAGKLTYCPLQVEGSLFN